MTGTPADLAADSTTVEVGDWLKLTASRSTITGVLLDSDKKTVRATLSAADSSLTTGGVGIGALNATNASASLDDWRGGNLGSVTIPEATAPGDYFASANGRHDAQGTEDDPWNIYDLFADQSRVPAGSTVWLRGGVYTPTTWVYALSGSAWIFSASGTSSSVRVTYRNYPGETVYFTASLCGPNNIAGITGDHVTVRGDIHFQNTNTSCRVTDQAGSTAPESRNGAGLALRGNDNVVVGASSYDNGNGFTNDKAKGPHVFYGVRSLNNGWEKPDGKGGNSFYTRNSSGLPHDYELIVAGREFNDVMHHQSALTDNMFWRKSFVGPTNGDWVAYYDGNTNTSPPNLFQELLLVGRFLLPGGQNHFDWSDNTIIGAPATAWGFSAINTLLFSGNFLYAQTYNVVERTGASVASDNNDFHTFEPDSARHFRKAVKGGASSYGTFAQFKAETNTDAASTYENLSAGGYPASNRVIVHANAYEPGRGIVGIVNFTGATQQEVDLSSILRDGDPYEIIDEDDPFSRPFATGTYAGGATGFPLDRTAYRLPIGYANPTYCWNSDCNSCPAERGWLTGTGDPVGACSAGQIYWRTDTNKNFYCNAGVWATENSGGCTVHTVAFGRHPLVHHFTVQRRQVYRTTKISWRGSPNDAISYGALRADGTIAWDFGPRPAVVCNAGLCSAAIPQLVGAMYYRINSGMPVKMEASD